jgi:hypothetical protein
MANHFVPGANFYPNHTPHTTHHTPHTTHHTPHTTHHTKIIFSTNYHEPTCKRYVKKGKKNAGVVYKDAWLTGRRADELRTLRVRDLSFDDVPFLVLNSSNENNGKRSSVPLRAESQLISVHGRMVAACCFGFLRSNRSVVDHKPRLPSHRHPGD